MAICPDCSSDKTRVIESTQLHDGGRRRRHLCRSCGFRWSTWAGAPPRRGRLPNSRPGRKSKPPLTEDQVRLILLSPLSSSKLARQLDRPVETVAGVRRGQFHKTTLPELPRRKPEPRRAYQEILPEGLPSCRLCKHWSNSKCDMGFPDPIYEGPGFAAECSVYAPLAARPTSQPAQKDHGEVAKAPEPLILALYRNHYVSPDDWWFSCPKAEDATSNECSCGASAHNARLDALVASLGSSEPELAKLKATIEKFLKSAKESRIGWQLSLQT